MALKFNPFTGSLDIVGSSGGSGIENSYALTFNNTSDWGTASGGLYSIVVPEGTHLKGVNPTANVYELVSGSYELVFVERLLISNSGQITISVLDSPDLRFSGKIIITR